MTCRHSFESGRLLQGKHSACMSRHPGHCCRSCNIRFKRASRSCGISMHQAKQVSWHHPACHAMAQHAMLWQPELHYDHCAAVTRLASYHTVAGFTVSKLAGVRPAMQRRGFTYWYIKGADASAHCLCSDAASKDPVQPQPGRLMLVSCCTNCMNNSHIYAHSSARL